MSLQPPPSDDDAVLDPMLNPEENPITVADSSDASEGGKLKMIYQLVKRSLGVKDIAAMRISLPASLLEPLPNLEYWHYLDRPDLFAAINDSTDPFERMLAVLRWTFSKDLKFVHGKIVKPYNSVLGEHFTAHWTVKPVTYPSDPTSPPLLHSDTIPPTASVPPSETASTRSSTTKNTKDKSVKSPRLSMLSGGTAVGSTSNVNGQAAARDLSTALAADPSSLSLGSGDSEPGSDRVRVVFLTEQVSHHPPISSFYCGVPDRGIEAVGVDQISARVSPTSLRVSPGSHNKGIFVSINSGPGAGEKYQITHPVAIVAGILRGSPYATITESTIITCTNPNTQQQLRAIIEYKEESWLGRAAFLVEGVIHEYDPDSTEHTEWTRVKHVPDEKRVATFEGCWRKRIHWKRAGETTKHTLVDLSAITPIPKTVRPIGDQLPYESRRLWQKVTDNLLSKNYGEATRQKQIIEQAQRDKAAEKKKTGTEHVPIYFESDISSGQPRLTAAGRKVIEQEIAVQP